MKKGILYLWIFVLAGGMIACEDDDIPPASYENGVWFYAPAEGSGVNLNTMEGFEEEFSTTYSFYFNEDSDVDTVELAEIRLMGMSTDYPREVNLVVGEGSTASEGVNFEFLDKVLPANEISFVPKILLKKAGLGEEEKILRLELAPSEEFPARIFADTVSDDKTFLISSHYTVKFSNLAIEPPYWNQCEHIFLTWSKVKYDFMVEKLGKYWGIEPVSPTDLNEMYNDKLIMRYELSLWQEEHGGEYMLDENGNRVSF